jgi:hypothetical protein
MPWRHYSGRRPEVPHRLDPGVRPGLVTPINASALLVWRASCLLPAPPTAVEQPAASRPQRSAAPTQRSGLPDGHHRRASCSRSIMHQSPVVGDAVAFKVTWAGLPADLAAAPAPAGHSRSSSASVSSTYGELSSGGPERGALFRFQIWDPNFA